ncbi:C39 family peptidase [Neobacillus mesonae]|uniref:C39 family peptidase n=1 Tax=Neobacillus mesonae TaxID=1193713 RepID=UPI00203A4698|nr:C39 family peptidase [Neobacillus mesonae]MCM3568730.1 C39 family peptidase [Neobacillus mesonae]
MKKLSFFLLLLPLLGCSQTDKGQESPTVNKKIEKKISVNNDSSHVKDPSKIEEYSIGDLNEQIINVGNRKTNSQTTNSSSKKDSALLNVKLIKQNPELKYGCEVTSLAMMLNYAGVKTNKMELYRLVRKDPDPLVKSPKGDILRWGNPADGFVGDMTGRRPGYAVFDKPMIDLINQKLPGRAVNLTNQPFERILSHVSNGHPVVIWTTGDYRLPDRPEGWYHGKAYIKTPLDLHVVVLVGYDANYVYLNDPLSGRKQVKAGKQQFISSWKALNRRAVSYR